MAQTEKGKLLRAGVIYTAASVLMKGISFLTLPIFIRLLTPEEFGRFNLFISYQSIIYLFSGFTLHASIKNARYDKQDDYDSYIKNCIYLDSFNCIAIFIVANTVCFFFQDKIGLSFYDVNLLTIAGYCSAIVSIYSSKLIMEYKAGDYAMISFVSVLVGIILSLLLIFTLFDFDHYLGRVIGAVCGEVVAAGYVLIKLFKTGFPKINPDHWRYGLKISLPIIPHGLSQVALSSANRIMINYIYSAAKAGIFSFTYTISMIPQILFQSVSSVWEPWFFEQMSKKDYGQIRKKSNMFCLVISAVFVMMASVTPEIIKILATEEYVEATDISIIVLMGCYFATLYNIPCEVEYYFKKTKHIATSTVVCALINIGLNLCLMQFFSYKIAAYVTLIAYLLYFLFHMYMSYYVGRRCFFDIRTMSFIIMASIALMTLSFVCIDALIVRIIVLLAVLVLIAIHYRSIFQVIKEIK